MTTETLTQYNKVLMIVWAEPGSGSRRALEISARLGWLLHYSFPKKPCSILRRYFWCLRDSMKKLGDVIPDIVVIQIGPSLACIAGIWAEARYGVTVVYDSHSSVYMSKKDKVFWWLRKIAFRFSRMVIIHNDEHIDKVKALGGKPVVLRDPVPRFPDVPASVEIALNKPAVFCPLSWRPDEPIKEIQEAAKQLDDFHFYLSGKPSSDYRMPDNVTLTGFLTPEEYLSYLKSCDVVLALTCQESTVCCAGYEAIAVRRPLVTSNTRVLRERFVGAAVFSCADGAEIALRIKQAYNRKSDLCMAASRLENRIEEEWTERSSFLCASFAQIHGANRCRGA